VIIRSHRTQYPLLWVALLCLTLGACSSAPRKATRQIGAGQEFSGFLSDYSRLRPNPKDGGQSRIHVIRGPTRNIHQYVGVIVEPVEVFLATDVDTRKLPDQGRTALAKYFRQAITESISRAFPVVQKPGAMVLRLRSALIGVDVGGGIATSPDLLINIGKVGVEMELVDSETGEQVAAAVDKQRLGDGIVFGSVNFSRDENFQAARRALDGWAARIRGFLDETSPVSGQAVNPAPLSR